MNPTGRTSAMKVGEPSMMFAGGPMQSAVDIIEAAGSIPVMTLSAVVSRIGPPTCGIGPSKKGQTCIEVRNATGIGITKY